MMLEAVSTLPWEMLPCASLPWVCKPCTNVVSTTHSIAAYNTEPCISNNVLLLVLGHASFACFEGSWLLSVCLQDA